MKQWMFVLGLLLFSFSGGADLSAAEDSDRATPLTILTIDIEGNRYVEKEMVLSKMGSKVGEPLSQRQLSRDVRNLHKSGFFSDVRFSGTRTDKGIHLVCHLKEYPLIAKVDFEGNDKHATKDLRLKLKLRPGRIFSPNNRESDLNTIRKGYLKDGYYQVDVKFISTPKEDGRVDVLVKIIEGEVTTIKRIGFIGNEVFSDSELRDQIASREATAVSWFTNADIFDQKRLGADTQLLEQFYLNNGYLDIRVESSQLVMAPDKKSFNLTLSLSEGDQYTVSGVEIQGDVVPDMDTLMEAVTLETGSIYALSDLRESMDAIAALVGDEGYAFASVTPLLKRNIEEDTVHVVLDIEKGEEVYVERVEIQGNEKTEDEVVRRLIDQSEGSRYSGTQVKRSKEAIQRAVYTEDARVSFPKGSADDKVNMKVELTEKKTGSFSIGVGFSTLEKLTLTGSVKEENLFGKGYMANVDFSLGKITQNYNATLTDPYFFGKDLSASVNLFKNQTEPFDVNNYSTNSIGGGVGVGIPITEHFGYSVNYRYQQTDLTIADLATASLMLQSQAGRQTTGELVQSLVWDSRNRQLAPNSGHVQQLQFGVAGLGGSNKFIEASFASRAYFGFGEDKDVVLNPSFNIGKILGYSGKQVPLFRRYSLGGIGTVRGFDSYGITIRDPVSGDTVGADKRMFASTNLFFPLPYMQTAGVRGLAFVDAGTVWGKATMVGVETRFKANEIRVSAGMGIEWISPVGPIGLIWALPIRKVQGDRERSIEFNMGGTF